MGFEGESYQSGIRCLDGDSLKSLRFPSTKDQEWGIILYRGIVRKNEDAFWPQISYKVAGRLGQAATLFGLEGISPGRSIELIPYGIMRGFRGSISAIPTIPIFKMRWRRARPGWTRSL